MDILIVRIFIDDTMKPDTFFLGLVVLSFPSLNAS